jgi:hypothetical protein
VAVSGFPERTTWTRPRSGPVQVHDCRGASTEGPIGGTAGCRDLSSELAFPGRHRTARLSDNDGRARIDMTQQVTTSTEKIDVKDDHLVERVKELVHEGNVRRIIIKDSDGRTVIEVPVAVGVVGLLIAPAMAAIAALAAVAADYSIEVERESPESADSGASLPA